MGALHRAVGRSGHPAHGGGAQRRRPGHDPAPGPVLRAQRPDAVPRGQQAAGVDGPGRHPLLRRSVPAARSPQAAALGQLGHVGRPGLPGPALHALPGPGDQRRPDLDLPGPDELPARRAVQGAAGRLLRLLPGLQPRQPGAGRAPCAVDEPAPGPPPHPPAGGVGGEYRGAGAAEGPGLLGAALRAVRGGALRGHRPPLLAAHRRRALPARRLVRRHPAQPRPAAHQRLAQRHGPRGLQRRGRLLAAGHGGSAWPRAVSWAPDGARATRTW